MVKNKKLTPTKFFLLPLFIFSFFLLIFNSPAKAAPLPLSYSVRIWATIGEPRLTLFGYTSPFANVFLQGGTTLSEQTLANSQGFFLFENIFLLQKIGDYCLFSQDRKGRVTSPVCLPPLPQGPYLVTVGPVLLPPTLSLAKGKFLPGAQVKAEGETIPSTQVEIVLFKEKRVPLFIRRIYAFSFPQYKISVDKNGYFSFNLPSFPTNTYRLFAFSFWNEKESPKSTTLTFKVLSFWEWLWEKIKRGVTFIFRLFRPQNLTLIIFAQILFIFFLLKESSNQKLTTKS